MSAPAACSTVDIAVPKINASSVPEHRAHQRQVLIDAARDLLVAEGTTALNFARVSGAVGLARSSVYEYFADRSALIVAVVAAEFPKWDHAARQAMATTEDPVEQVLAYARIQLELVAAGEHRIAVALRGVALTDDVHRQFRELHLRLTAPLRDALAGSGTGTDPSRWAGYVQGVIDAATIQLEGGEDPESAIPGALAFLRAALR